MRTTLAVLAVLLLVTACGSTPPPSQPLRSATAGGVPAGCGRAPGVPVGATSTQSLSSGGYQRSYLVHLPAGYQQGRPAPVVLVFHGRKGTGDDIEKYSGIDGLDAVAVYPRGLPASDGETAWQGAPGASPTDDVRFVADLLDRLAQTLCLDPARVYATGKSEGAGFTALLACRLPDRIAAFATVSGAFYPATGQGCGGSPPVPLLDLHGTADPVIHYAGGASHRLAYPAMPDWLRGWAGHNHCAGSGDTAIGTDVTRTTWTGCAPGSTLVHYRIAGGGHTWPGATAPSGPGGVTHTVSATAVMWSFFTSL
ncbi:MAG TPA: PHB depolymerase family esterase [Pseudonocardia sp.]|uniref:alpha/beta hydrolase family esterase n=1 Tax=Pseudonocardia sp. TaxID=60912 RepID=UPI002F3E96DA